VFIGIPLCVKIPAIESSIPTIEIYFYYFSGFDSIKWGAGILLQMKGHLGKKTESMKYS